MFFCLCVHDYSEIIASFVEFFCWVSVKQQSQTLWLRLQQKVSRYDENMDQLHHFPKHHVSIHRHNGNEEAVWRTHCLPIWIPGPRTWKQRQIVISWLWLLWNARDFRLASCGKYAWFCLCQGWCGDGEWYFSIGVFPGQGDRAPGQLQGFCWSVWVGWGIDLSKQGYHPSGRMLWSVISPKQAVLTSPHSSENTAASFGNHTQNCKFCTQKSPDLVCHKRLRVKGKQWFIVAKFSTRIILFILDCSWVHFSFMKFRQERFLLILSESYFYPVSHNYSNGNYWMNLKAACTELLIKTAQSVIVPMGNANCCTKSRLKALVETDWDKCQLHSGTERHS